MQQLNIIFLLPSLEKKSKRSIIIIEINVLNVFFYQFFSASLIIFSRKDYFINVSLRLIYLSKILGQILPLGSDKNALT